MQHSKSLVDRAGKRLLEWDGLEYDEKILEADIVLDDFRESHLKPLSEITIKIQNFLRKKGVNYYISQRLKRKPQIIRKIKRLSVRLSQLQDIGGNRIIVESNGDVDKIYQFLIDGGLKEVGVESFRSKDYRDFGRDDSGYRSLHLILSRGQQYFELQIRSKMQHFWSESIERTSIIYGFHLKELEGDLKVISYFKSLSNAFHEMECGRQIGYARKIRLEQQRIAAEDVIGKSKLDKLNFVSGDSPIIKSIVEQEKFSGSEFNNWILVFDWNSASFVSWELVAQDASLAAKSYSKYEKDYRVSDGFEVVLIGSSDVKTVQETHSHYFGITKFENIIASLDESVLAIESKLDISFSSKYILGVLVRKKFWYNKTILVSTLKNHFCKSIDDFQAALDRLEKLDIISINMGLVSLNKNKKAEIEALLS